MQIKSLNSPMALLLLTLAAISIVIISAANTPCYSQPVYVGSAACKNCHAKEYKSFTAYAKKSRSFESIEKLRKGLTSEEIKNCYVCHTTGYGKPGGFESEEKTPHLKNTGCEVCHGPGSAHIKTKNSKDIKNHLTMQDCEECHTSERVKAFRYKPMIHGGAH